MSEDIKSEAQRLLDQRLAVYGDRVENMKRVALMWTGILGFEVRPDQVPLMFSAYKIYRASITPDYSDNADDIDGYQLMFREVVESEYPHGMVHARTVDDYLQIKNQGSQAEGRVIDDARRERIADSGVSFDKEPVDENSPSFGDANEIQLLACSSTELHPPHSYQSLDSDQEAWCVGSAQQNLNPSWHDGSEMIPLKPCWNGMKHYGHNWRGDGHSVMGYICRGRK